MIAVDLDKVLLEVCKGCNEEFSEEPCEPGFCMIRSAIEDVPVLTLDDLRPKGRWVPNEPESDVWFHCSECETDISTSWDYDCDQMWNYCPNCGADMRGYMSDGQRNQDG